MSNGEENTRKEEATEEEITELLETVREQEERLTVIQEDYVATAAVEYVLREYGLSEERVDEITETIERVDSKLGGGSDV
jgi:DNA-binding Lrp family transcriptional regulator